MAQDLESIARRLVVGHQRDGRSIHDPQARSELVRVRQQPGVSLPRIARLRGCAATRADQDMHRGPAGRCHRPFRGAGVCGRRRECGRVCVVNGIDVHRCLKALLIALPRAKTMEDYEALLPWRIALDTACSAQERSVKGVAD